MSSSQPDAHNPAVEYDLNIHAGAVSTVFRLRDNGIRLAGTSIEWRIGGQARHAALSDIQVIRLTNQYETEDGPAGATTCQIGFRDNDAVTVFGGNSRSPDATDRKVRYEAFVIDLHRRLRSDDRARISFIAGFGGFRFYSLLVATTLFTLVWVAAVLIALFGLVPLRFEGVATLPVAGIFVAALFRLLHLNAPHIYDPRDPIGSARTGSIGDTLRRATDEIRRGMTRARWFMTTGIGLITIAGIAVAIASHQRADLFGAGRARLAFDAVLARIAPAATVTYVAVTPGELLVETPDSRRSSSRIDWRASRRTLFGWSEWDHVDGPMIRYSTSVAENLDRQPFELDRMDAAGLDDLANAAVERVALGPGSAVTLMTLTAPNAIVKPGTTRWTIEIEGPGGQARLYADHTGKLFPKTPEPAGPPRIVITAVAGDSSGLFPRNAGAWIRIINPDQSVRFDGTLKPGDSYRVPDIAGLRLQTGKLESLAFTVDGHPARLPPANGEGRFDVPLDPPSMLTEAQIQK